MKCWVFQGVKAEFSPLAFRPGMENGKFSNLDPRKSPNGISPGNILVVIFKQFCIPMNYKQNSY